MVGLTTIETEDTVASGADAPVPRDPSPGAAWARALDEFESGVADVCGHLHGLHARLVALVVEALERGWWQQSGVKSPEQWLGWQTGLSSAQASKVVAVARRWGDLPATMAAFEAGELSLDQVVPIVARVPTWADAEVCELARLCTVGQIRAAVGRYAFPDIADDDTDDGQTDDAVQPAGSVEIDSGDEAAHPDDPVPERRPGDTFWSFLGDVDGSWRAAGRFDADHGLVIDAALREVGDALFRESGRVATGGEVLAEMARRSLGTVTDSSRRDRYRVHVTLDTNFELLDPFGHTLPPWVRDLITCDATMAVTWTRHGVPIAQGSTAESIPAAVRRHVLARDHGCRVPGCGSRVRLDLHHVIHRRDGGSNDTRNLIAICPHHHRMHHRNRLGISGDADADGGLVFTDHRGRPIGVNQLIRPPTGPPPKPAGRYRHPLGERLDLRWIYFNPPPEARGPACGRFSTR